MKNLLPILFLAICGSLSAQLTVDKKEYDFGTIQEFNNDTAFFTFTNTGAKNIYLLSTPPDGDYAVLCSSKTIAPGASVQFAIVYYTGKKGRFEKEILLNFSHLNTPYKLLIKGNIKNIRETAYNTCPSIENSKPLQASQIPLTIVVRDGESGNLIAGAAVDVIAGNWVKRCVPGFGNTIYSCNATYGTYSVKAAKQGYREKQEEIEYDKDHHRFLILLYKNADTVLYKEEKVEKKTTIKDTIAYKVPEDPVYVPAIYADSGFNSYRYKPNHLIFIIDISGSMKDSGKLDYLKLSIIKLIEAIRPGDYITLITYTNKVRVVFEHVSGLHKNALITAIDTLKAKGGSNGSQSLVMAYELAKLHYIVGGNNQVFLATDGLLNSSKITNEDLYKLAERSYRKDGIILSTIGFGNDPSALDFLQKLSKKGRGNFIRIQNTGSDISNLLEEVKIQSSR